MLSTLLQCCIVLVMQRKLIVVVIWRFWRISYISTRYFELFSEILESILGFHSQRRLQKHFKNQTNDLNGVTFITTRTDMSPRGTLFRYCSLEREGRGHAIFL